MRHLYQFNSIPQAVCEFIEHKTDSVAIGKREFNCLSPNNGISVYQFYLDTVNYDLFQKRFNRICLVSYLESRKYGCDSIVEYDVPDSLTYSNGYFKLYKLDSVQSKWLAIYNESVFNVYGIFSRLEELWDDKESPSYLTIHEWTKYYERRWRNSIDRQ